jgi:hypothetical protein
MVAVVLLAIQVAGEKVQSVVALSVWPLSLQRTTTCTVEVWVAPPMRRLQLA